MGTNRRLKNQEIENNRRNKEILKICLIKSRRLKEKQQNEFEKIRNIFKRRNLKFKKKKILEDEKPLRGYMVNWPIRKEKSRKSNIKNIIYFQICKLMNLEL